MTFSRCHTSRIPLYLYNDFSRCRCNTLCITSSYAQELVYSLRAERLINFGSASGQYVSLQRLQKRPVHNPCNIIPISQAYF